MIVSQVQVKIIFPKLYIKYFKIFFKINLHLAKSLILISFIESIENYVKKSPTRQHE